MGNIILRYIFAIVGIGSYILATLCYFIGRNTTYGEADKKPILHIFNPFTLFVCAFIFLVCIAGFFSTFE